VDNNAVVQQVGQAIQVVGGIAKENYKRNIQEEIATKAQSLELALTARAFPKFANQLFSEYAKDDPIVKNAMMEMGDISNALRQGVLPHQYALQRLSVIKSNAIEAAPEFADEISAAVQDVTGRDPNKAFFAELLAPRQLTEQEKAVQQAEKKIQEQMALTGFDRNTVVTANQARFMADLEDNQLKALTKRGERLSINLKRRARLTVNAVTQDTLVDLMQQVKTGGVVDKELMIAQYNERVDAKIAELIADLPPGANPSIANADINMINIARNRMIGQIKDGSMVNLVTDRRDLLEKGLRLEIMQQSPEMAFAFAVAPGDATKGIDLVAKMQQYGEEGRKLAGELSTVAKLFNETEGARTKFFNYYNKLITNGEIDTPDPVSTEEKNLHAIAAHTAMTSTDPVVQSSALKELVNQHGEDFAFGALEDRNILQAVNPQTMGQALEGLQRTQTAALSNTFPNIARLPAFAASKFGFEGNTLTYKDSATAFEAGIAPGGQFEIQEWVNEFNKVSRISKMYVDGGIMNQALYPNPQDYFRMITKDTFDALNIQEDQRQRGAATTAPAAAPVKWVRGDDGIPRVAGGQ
jgi:hypothetical protein